MANFCTKCGTRVEEGITFCPSCGSRIEIQPQPQSQYQNYSQPQYSAPQQTYSQPQHQYSAPQQPNYSYQQAPAPQVQPEQPKKKSKKGLIIAIVALVAIAAVVGILFATGVFGDGNKTDKPANTPEAVAEAFMDAYCDLDAEKALNCYPSFLWENDNDIKAEMIEDIQEGLDYMGGYRTNMSYTILDTTDPDKYDLEKIEELIAEFEEEFSDFDSDDISEYKVVSLEASFTVDGETETMEERVYLIKYKGEWKIIYPYI